MKVLKDFKNKLCDRIEYKIELDHSSKKTPQKVEVKKKLAELFKIKEDLIALKGIHTRYGHGKSIINAHTYNNEESFKNFEIRNKKDGKKKKTKKQDTK